MKIFHPMFDFTLCNYGGHVGGNAKVHQHVAPHTFTLNIQKFCSAITLS